MKLANCAGAVGIAWAAFASPVIAQISLAEMQARMSGTWIATVEGEARKRVLTVTTVAQSGEGKFVVVGHYNFADDPGSKIYPVADAEMVASGGATTITFRSTSGTVVTASAKADTVFEGSTKYANGQVKPIRLEKGVHVALKRVNKDELRQLVSGKEVVIRTPSGSEISWTLGSDGTLHGWVLNGSGRDEGRWSINDAGHFCTEWMGRSASGCLVALREGEKLKFLIPVKMTHYADVKEIKAPK